MNTQSKVRELVAWGVDDTLHRPALNRLSEAIDRGRVRVANREPWTSPDPIATDVPASVTDLLASQLQRTDLHEEMQGLSWTTGIVDLRRLLAFQRRLIFDESLPHFAPPCPNNWPALISLAFGPPVPIACTTFVSSQKGFVLQSENPNFHLRPNTSNPFQLYGGSPFFEVAEFRARWFLRDGYHRAYHLLRANITHIPAVIIHARTLAELGPVHPWFFSEETLFDSHPPRLTDFLDDDLTIQYKRPRLLKTLRVTIEESVEPALSFATSGVTP